MRPKKQINLWYFEPTKAPNGQPKDWTKICAYRPDLERSKEPTR